MNEFLYVHGTTTHTYVHTQAYTHNETHAHTYIFARAIIYTQTHKYTKKNCIMRTQAYRYTRDTHTRTHVHAHNHIHIIVDDKLLCWSRTTQTHSILLELNHSLRLQQQACRYLQVPLHTVSVQDSLEKRATLTHHLSATMICAIDAAT